ncbi:MAG: hypothetical protein H7222_09725 [Methylotenera sp.]|nr:hypothetical protein [Oligoflexia bacterium]
MKTLLIALFLSLAPFVQAAANSGDETDLRTVVITNLVTESRPKITPCRAEQIVGAIHEALRKKGESLNPNKDLEWKRTLNGATETVTRKTGLVIEDLKKLECQLNELGYSLLDTELRGKINIGSIGIDSAEIAQILKYLELAKATTRELAKAYHSYQSLKSIKDEIEKQREKLEKDPLALLILGSQNLPSFEKPIPDFPSPKKRLMGEVVKILREKLDFNKTKKWELNEGPTSIIAAHAEARYTTIAREDTPSMSITADAWSGGYLFGKQVRLLEFDACAATKAGECTPEAVGARISFHHPKLDIKAYVQEAVERATTAGTMRKILEPRPEVAELATFPKVGAQFSFPVGPIVITAAVGVTGDARLNYYIESTNTGVKGGIKPTLNALAYAAASAGVGIASIGVEADLTILSAGFDLNGESDLTIKPDTYWPEIKVLLNSAGDIHSLDGHIDAYAEVNLWIFSERISRRILSWPATFKGHYNIMDYEFTIGRDGPRFHGQDATDQDQKRSDHYNELDLANQREDLKKQYYEEVEKIRTTVQADFNARRPQQVVQNAAALEDGRHVLEQAARAFIEKVENL